MCGRYFLALEALLELEKRVDYKFERDLLVARDYYPSNNVPIIVYHDYKLTISKVKWGYSGFNNKLIINARSETLLNKPMFKNDARAHRCIIPTTGFYEWDSHKRKFTFENNDGSLMMLAGIYRFVESQIEMVIVTTKANNNMKGIHHRMPLILNEKLAEKWLTNNQIESILNSSYNSLKITSGVIQECLF